MGKKIHQGPKTIGNITLERSEADNGDKLKRLAALVDRGNEDKLERLIELLETEEDVTQYKPYVEKAAKNSILKAQYIMAKEMGPFSLLKLSIMKKAAAQNIMDSVVEYEKANKNFKKSIFFMVVSNIVIVAIMIYVLYRMSL